MDLNLLRVFDALMQTGSVTAAADELRLSTPATSRALARLRRAMGDEIMVRAGRGLVPTPFAQQSAHTVRRLLEDAGQLTIDAQGDDPAHWRRTFTIRINDALVPVLAPAVLAQAGAAAPGVLIRLVAEEDESPEALRDGSIDLDVGVSGPGAPDITRQDLCQDRYVATFAEHSPLARSTQLTIEDLCSHPHISASRRGRTRGPIDTALQELGRHRQVIATVPSMTAAAILALEQDVVVPMPSLLATHLISRGLPLTQRPLPVDVPVLDIAIHWHHRLDADRPTAWLRTLIQSAIAQARESD